MRIVHVVRQFSPGVGGLENFVLSLATAQVAQGHAVGVATLDRLTNGTGERLPSEEKIGGIDVFRFSFAGSRRYPIAPRVLRAIQDADIVHVHGVDFFCDYLALTKPYHGKPLVLSTHGGFFHTGFAKTLKKVFFQTVTRTSLLAYKAVFACSENDRELFARVAGARLKLINNGVDTKKFEGAASPEFTNAMIYVGRLAENKGLFELLLAFSATVERLPDARLEIVGSDWDGIRDGLEREIERLGLAQNVRIHSGLDDAGVRQLMGQCSFFTSASQYEGFGMTLVEAMAAGLIPLVNRIPTFGQILKHGEIGAILDFSDPLRAGAEMARRMAEFRETYARDSKRVRAAAEPYNWKGVAETFTKEYERILGIDHREILGVPFKVYSKREAVERIDQAIGSGDTLKVAFANAHTLNIAASNPDLRNTLRKFLVLNDGIGVDLASWRYFGRSFPENLNGTDFIPHYLANSRRRLRIFLVGATASGIEKAAARLASEWPQHEFIGARSGYFSDREEILEACSQIEKASADVVLVGLGNPLQELWIEEFAKLTGAKALFGVGALFDFTAGSVSRAPEWVRRLKCEWLYRLAQEPKRLWRRYLVGNAVFLYRVVFQQQRGRGPEIGA